MKSADWDYIDLCAKVADPIPLFGNGDVFTYEDYNLHKKNSNVAGKLLLDFNELNIHLLLNNL